MAAGKAAPRTPRFFTVDEVAEFLSLSTRTVRRVIDEHQLPAHRFGRAVRISEDDLRIFIATHRAG
jgi:excisionase family DNA binding protein